MAGAGPEQASPPQPWARHCPLETKASFCGEPGPVPCSPLVPWHGRACLASPAPGLPSLSPGLPCLHRKLYFAQSHKPPFHGRVCVAPPGCLLSASPDGPTKGFFYVPSEKGTGGPWGLGRPAPPCLTAPTVHSAQGPPLGHLRLQPLREHRLREAGRAAPGGHGGHGLRGLRHHWPQPHPARGQPRHWRPGRWPLWADATGPSAG